MSMENAIIDLHALVIVLLREYLELDGRRRHIFLESISDQPISYLMHEYIPEDEQPVTDSSTFKESDHKSMQYLTGSDVENIFWRCKHYDDNVTVVRALQVLLNDLPSSTKLLIRTSRGHSLICKAHSFKIVTNTIRLKEQRYIMTPFSSGDEKPIIMGYCLGGPQNDELRWIAFVFQEDNSVIDPVRENSISLDVVAPMIGLRGHGGEPFVLEWTQDYLDLLSSVAQCRTKNAVSTRQDSSYAKIDGGLNTLKNARKLADVTIQRWKRILNGEETFCSHCGKDNPRLSCPKSDNFRYCNITCLASGIRYHVQWCRNANGSV